MCTKMAAKTDLAEVELGFLEKYDTTAEPVASSFPSKVGGKPVWLDPVHLPPADKLLCKQCGKPSVLLLQIYAPITDRTASRHRNVYVFVCRDPSCHRRDSNKPFRVFRCSLGKENDYYSDDESEEDIDNDEESGEEIDNGKEEVSTVQNAPVTSNSTNVNDHTHSTLSVPSKCLVCGCLGLKRCGQCNKVHYCSREHQKWDWRAGHKLLCDDIAAGKRMTSELGYQPGSGLLMPVFEIVTETERVVAEDEERSEADR